MANHGNCIDSIGMRRASGPLPLTWQGWLREGYRLFAQDTRALFDLLVVWQERASTRHHLRSLDDRILKDIGLSRAEAEREAAKSFWRE